MITVVKEKKSKMIDTGNSVLDMILIFCVLAMLLFGLPVIVMWLFNASLGSILNLTVTYWQVFWLDILLAVMKNI